MLAQSFDQTEENIRLILQQRASRRLRVRPKPLATTFGINDKEEKDKLIEQHLLQRDIKNYKSTKIDDEPVDSRVLAEENRILSRERPSEIYLSKEVRRFFLFFSFRIFSFRTTDFSRISSAKQRRHIDSRLRRRYSIE